MDYPLRRFAISSLALALCSFAAPSSAEIIPNYTLVVEDCTTDDNAFIGADEKRYWTIDPGCDSYQNEYYERPTVASYDPHEDMDGNDRYSTDEYYENLDIREGKFGYDETYMYFAIEMVGLNRSTSDGVDIKEGLVYEYDIRISTDPDGRGGLLLRSTQPELKQGTTFGTEANQIFWDSDGDVGGLGIVGPTGLNVTKEDNPNEESTGSVDMNGFDIEVAADGKLKIGPDDMEVLFTRIDPNNENIVEFALDYKKLAELLGMEANLPELLQYLDFQSVKGDPMDPANYMWNDKYTKSEAGSPYAGPGGLISEFGTQGLGNLYELDTLRGIGPPVIPEPATVALMGMGLLGFALRRKLTA